MLGEAIVTWVRVPVFNVNCSTSKTLELRKFVIINAVKQCGFVIDRSLPEHRERLHLAGQPPCGILLIVIPTIWVQLGLAAVE